MKTTLLASIIALLSFQAYSMECKTPRGEVEFEWTGKTITFFTDKENVSRELASSQLDSLVFHEGQSVTQVFEYKGVKHMVHLQNIDRPNEHEDYLLLSNQKGEKMLYPLNCSLGKKALVSLR